MKISLAVVSLLTLVSALPAMAEVNGEIELGVGYLDDSAWRYGKYSGLIDEGFEGLLTINLNGRSEDGTYWRAGGENLGLDSRHLWLTAGQYGSQRLRLDYRGMPRYLTDSARTPMMGAGLPQLSLPANWQASDATTAGMSRLEESLTDLSLWQERRTLKLDYRRFVGDNWTLKADWRRDRVDGVRALGGVSGATGGNNRALLLPAPIDYETYSGELSLGYAGERHYWGLGYYTSVFSNHQPSLSWPTPYAAHPQWAPGTGYPGGDNRLALEPDNQAHQLRLHGGYHFTGTTRLHLDAALGRLRQDEDFLPYTINPALEVSEPLPRQSLDARVDTTRVNLRLTSRPARALNLVARINFRDRDNKTPRAAYQRVRGDAVPQQSYEEARINRPYSLRVTDATTDLAWRVSRHLRLEAGLGYNDTRRDYSEVNQTRETSLTLGARTTRFTSVALSTEYRYLERRADEYVGNRPMVATHVPGTVGAEDFENHPLLRKYTLTDRDRHLWRVRGDWFVWQRVNLGAAIAYHRDTYPEAVFGLTRSEMMSYTVDIGYAPTDQLRLSAFANFDRYRNDQSGRSFRGSVPADAWDANRNWQAGAEDHFNTLGMNLDWEQLHRQFQALSGLGGLDVRLSLTHSRATGEIAVTTGDALTDAPLPDLSTELNTASLEARLQLSARSSLRLGVEHERYRSRDFALDGVAPDAVATVLLLGEASPRYDITWTTLAWRYQF